MPVKSKKEIQTENSELKQKLINVTSNFEKLSQEHKSLKTELIQEREKGKNRCNKCDKISENGKNLKKHMNDRRSTVGLFKCDQCTKVFNDEWKLSAHNKKHEKYQCDQCEKSFDYIDIKRKHILISHQNVKLYCHF